MPVLAISHILRNRGHIVYAMAILFLSGCASVGPDYVPPDISVPPTWHSAKDGLLNANETDAVDLTQMELHVDVDEADLGPVRVGEEATFTVDAYPDRIFRAKTTQESLTS